MVTTINKFAFIVMKTELMKTLIISIYSIQSNWGDHCGMVAANCKEDGKSVVTHRTPAGLMEKDWRKGLELYSKAQK